MGQAEPTFAELVERAGRGDRAATEELYRRYEPAIRRVVRFELLGNPLKRVLDESDVCQSVAMRFFLGLWDRKFAFDGPEDMVKLLKVMVHNRVADHGRYHGAERRKLAKTIAADPDRPIDHAGREETASQIVGHEEIVAEVERRLTDGERKMLELRRQGRSWDEVGAEFKIAAAAARMRFTRGMARVLAELGLDEDLGPET